MPSAAAGDPPERRGHEPNPSGDLRHRLWLVDMYSQYHELAYTNVCREAAAMRTSIQTRGSAVTMPKRRALVAGGCGNRVWVCQETSR